MRWILLIYAVMSVITFVVYGLDKRSAMKGRWRRRESTLHGLELLGGVPGALLGQRVFRHKTRKRSFLVVTWAIVVLHAAGWIWWLTRRGG